MTKLLGTKLSGPRALTLALTLALVLAWPASLAAVPARDQPASECIVRGSEPDGVVDPELHQQTAWVVVQQPGFATVSAYGVGFGPELGTFRLTLLQDGALLARSSQDDDFGQIVAQTSSYVKLAPNHRYKFTVKPDATKKQIGLVRLRIAVGGKCP